jgi:hypothetical protein
MGGVEEFAAERAALDLLHAVVAMSTSEAQGKLLRTAFIPTHRDVLIHAGLECAQLVHEDGTDSEPSEGAFTRLETITSKLRMMPPDAELARAIGEFEAKLKMFRAARSSANRMAVVLVAVLLGLVGLVVWFFLRH